MVPTLAPGSAEHQLMTVFTSYSVYLTSLVIVAIMTTLRKAVRIYRGREPGERNPWLEIAIQVGNVPLGILFGLAPGFLPGDSYCERTMVGAVAGFMSSTIYSVAKRFLPSLMESDAPEASVPAHRSKAKKEESDA